MEPTALQFANSFNSLSSLQFLLSKKLMETRAMVYIKKVLERAHQNGHMVGIINQEGVGKSTAIADYLYTNEMVYYIRVGESYRNKRLLQELVHMVSGVFPSETQDTFILIKRLSWLLSTNDTNKKLVIIDDAGKLNARGLGHFHELRDNTQANVAYAFVGLPYFKLNLERWKLINKQGIGEFYRRVESWYDRIPQLTKEEKSEYCKMRGISSASTIDLIISNANTIAELEFEVGKYLESGLEASKLSSKKSSDKFDLGDD